MSALLELKEELADTQCQTREPLEVTRAFAQRQLLRLGVAETQNSEHRALLLDIECLAQELIDRLDAPTNEAERLASQ